MSIYMSRAELEEISEGLITAYANKFMSRVETITGGTDTMRMNLY